MLINDVKRYLEGVLSELMNKYSTSFTSDEINTPAFSADNTEVHVPTVPTNDNSTKAASTEYVNNKVQASGGGDMLKSVYDPNADGIIGIEQGGTGQSTVAGARNVLGLGNTTGALPVANGGTGADNAADARINIGAASQAEIADIVNVYGSKNFISIDIEKTRASNTTGAWSGNSYTINGITFTINADGTVTANGTASALAGLWLIPRGQKALILPVGDYRVTSTPSGGSNDKYFTELTYTTSNNTGQAIGNEYGSGYNFSITSSMISTYFDIGVNLYVMNGQTVSNILFKPMIRCASIQDDTYEPYAKTNKQLTDDKAEKKDLTSINITSGTTNNTGAKITAGKYFYYNGALVKAKVDIADGATLTFNTNYESAYMGDDVATIKSSLANKANSSDLTWKSVGSTVGSTVLKIPTSNWEELYIQARVFGTPLCCCSVYTCNNIHEERDYMVYGYLTQNIINAAHLTNVLPQEWWARIYVRDDNIQISEASVGIANIYAEAYYR